MATVKSITKGLSKMVSQLEALADTRRNDAFTYRKTADDFMSKANDAEAEAGSAEVVAKKINALIS